MLYAFATDLFWSRWYASSVVEKMFGWGFFCHDISCIVDEADSISHRQSRLSKALHKRFLAYLDEASFEAVNDGKRLRIGNRDMFRPNPNQRSVFAMKTNMRAMRIPTTNIPDPPEAGKASKKRAWYMRDAFSISIAQEE